MIQPAPARTVFLDVELSFLVESYGAENAPACRRLNAVENMMMRLSMRWRPFGSLRVHRELRMSEPTVRALLAWVTAGVGCSEPCAPRLRHYVGRDVVHAGVPDGVIRMLLPDRSPAALEPSGDDASSLP